MAYQAKRNGEYDLEQQEISSAEKNANNIRNAANVAIATNNPYASAAGYAVKAADKISGGKASEDLGKAISKANQMTPGGKYLQDSLDMLNDSGISDKVGDAAFAYHKYVDHANKQPKTEEQNKSKKSQLNSENSNNNNDDNLEGEFQGKTIIKKIAVISIIAFLPLILIFIIIASIASMFTNFEDALGSSYINNETIGGFVEVPENTKEAQKFYKQIEKEKEKKEKKGMIFESVKIIAVYNTINNENPNFTYAKMTKNKIEEIAKAMFKEEKDSEGQIIYIYDQELFEKRLKEEIYRKQFLFYKENKLAEMAKNTIQYINDYYAYVGENPSNLGNISSGTYTSWKQYSGPWTNIKLGNSGKSISQIGCAATSVSILIAKSKTATTVTPLNPGTFVEKMNQNGGFGAGACQGCINWAKATVVAPSFRYVGKMSVITNTKEQKLSTLKTLLEQGYYVVAEVKGNTGEHWVAIDGIQQNNIIMIDPGSTSTNLWQKYSWQNTSTYVYYRVV